MRKTKNLKTLILIIVICVVVILAAFFMFNKSYSIRSYFSKIVKGENLAAITQVLPPVIKTPTYLAPLGGAIQVCTASCGSLPIPVFKVCPTSNPQCSPKNHYTIKFNLDGQPLTTFNTPIIVAIPYVAWNGQPGYTAAPDYSVSLVSSAGVVTTNGGLYVFNGTNTISVYQDTFTDQNQKMFLWLMTHDIKIYNGTNTNTNFISQKISNASANIILIKDNSVPISSQDALQASLPVSISIDKLFNKSHITYNLYAVPALFSTGSEGEYMGNSNLSIFISPGTKNDIISVIKSQMAHEYTHAMQFERGNYGLEESKTQSGITGNYSPFIEGMADSVAEFTGYKTSSQAFQLSKQSTNCIQDFTDPHDIGRCIFKDFFGLGLFNTTFFQKLISLDKIYDFGNVSPINNSQYCNTLSGIMSYASGRDMSNIIYQEGCTTLTAVVPTSTCDSLKSSQAFYFSTCLSTGFDNVCFDKNSGAYQGCEKNSNNSCTANNTHAAQNMLCPVK